MKYDYMIAGAGLTGCVIAHELRKKGMSVLVCDNREHIAGNIFTKDVKGIEVHEYGPHIFHTNSDRIWDYIKQFTEFINYKHKVRALSNGNLYTLPFNLSTLYEIHRISSPLDAKKFFQSLPQVDTDNLEQQAINSVGVDIYDRLIKHYTAKQWNANPKTLPASIIKRLPIRTTFNDSYYEHRYEGIPKEGYTKAIENMLNGLKVELKCNITFDNWQTYAKRLVYTGPIDSLFGYEYGKLPYRSLSFRHEMYEFEHYQGCAQINYCDLSVDHTRSIEHKYFNNVRTTHTIVTFETPTEYVSNLNPYYPIESKQNIDTYKKYENLAKHHPSIIIAGRLGCYKYYDMDQAIGAALRIVSVL
jgi:UDP-galactopyranose mutase